MALLIVAVLAIGYGVGRAGLRAEAEIAPQRPTRPGPELLAEVRDQLGRGRKIQAIKTLREGTNMSLKQAKDAVDAMQYGRLDAPAGPAPVPPTDLAASTRNIRETRGMAAAIGFVREQTGMNFGEAQAFIQALE